MKAAFLTSSLIAPKGKALPASRATTPTKLLDDESNRQSGVSRIYERVSEYADPHEDNESLVEVAAASAAQNSSSQTDENEIAENAIVLHEDETVSIVAGDDIYDFSKPEDEPQSVFDRIREHNTDIDSTEPISPLLQRHTANAGKEC